MHTRRLPLHSHPHLPHPSPHSTTLVLRISPYTLLPLRSITILTHPSHCLPHLHPSSSPSPTVHPPFPSSSPSSPSSLSLHRLPFRSLFGFSAPQPVTQTIRRRVPFAPATFFAVILDVSSYHLFLPFCVASTITPHPSSPPSLTSPSTFTAQLTVGFRVFTESYTSLVRADPPHTISVTAQQSSIFHHLNSTWTFTPVPSDPHSTDVRFTIDFLVKSRMHAGAVQMFFGDVTEQQMQAFVKRAAEIGERERGEREGEGVGEGKGVERGRGMEGGGVQALATAATKPQAVDGPPVVDMAVPPPPAPRVPASAAAPKRAPPAPASLPARRAKGEQGKAPVVPVQPTFRPLYSPQVRFTNREVQQLRALFREYASGRGAKSRCEGKDEAEGAPTLSEMTEEHARQPQRTNTLPSTPSSYPHLTQAGDYVNERGLNGASLLLSFPSFCHLCAHLSLPTSGVFSKYRERASLRACGEDEAIAVACFASQPTLYRYAGSGQEGEDASPAFTHSHPLSTHHRRPPLHPQQLRAAVINGPGLSLGEFIEVIWGLVRATNGERLHSTLMKAVAKEGGEGRLSEERLRAETLAFFALQLGVIRQVMPAMVVRRSRDMDRELGGGGGWGGGPRAGRPDGEGAVPAGHGGADGVGADGDGAGAG